MDPFSSAGESSIRRGRRSFNIFPWRPFGSWRRNARSSPSIEAQSPGAIAHLRTRVACVLGGPREMGRAHGNHPYGGPDGRICAKSPVRVEVCHTSSSRSPHLGWRVRDLYRGDVRPLRYGRAIYRARPTQHLFSNASRTWLPRPGNLFSNIGQLHIHVPENQTLVPAY